MTGDSVVKTLMILFLIAISPLILAMAIFVGYLWWGVLANG